MVDDLPLSVIPFTHFLVSFLFHIRTSVCALEILYSPHRFLAQQHSTAAEAISIHFELKDHIFKAGVHCRISVQSVEIANELGGKWVDML